MTCEDKVEVQICKFAGRLSGKEIDSATAGTLILVK